MLITPPAVVHLLRRSVVRAPPTRFAASYTRMPTSPRQSLSPPAPTRSAGASPPSTHPHRTLERPSRRRCRRRNRATRTRRPTAPPGWSRWTVRRRAARRGRHPKTMADRRRADAAARHRLASNRADPRGRSPIGVPPTGSRGTPSSPHDSSPARLNALAPLAVNMAIVHQPRVDTRLLMLFSASRRAVGKGQPRRLPSLAATYSHRSRRPRRSTSADRQRRAQRLGRATPRHGPREHLVDQRPPTERAPRTRRRAVTTLNMRRTAAKTRSHSSADPHH